MTQTTTAAEPRISAQLLRPVVRALIGERCDHHALLAAEGLSAADLEDPERRIPHSVGLRFLESATRKSGKPELGLMACIHADLSDLGLLGQLLTTAPSVRSAIERTHRFGMLLHDAASSYGEEKDGLYFWYLTLEGVPMTVTSFEAFIGACVGRLALRLGTEWSPRELWFPYPQPAHVTVYERFFRCPMRFEMPSAAAVFDARVLELTNPVDGAISQLIERRAEAALERLEGRSAFAARVRDVLAEQLDPRTPNAEAVARAMHVSRATLTRRLAAEGTSLTAVLDALRRDLAMEYLRVPSLSLEEVARRLGFSDARALRRAFVRWTGKPPARIRNELTERTNNGNA